MDKFDIRGAKLISIIGLILFIFIMVVANAYQYLPSESSDLPNVNNEINLPSDEDENTSEDDTRVNEEPSKESLYRDNRSLEDNNSNSYSNENITPLENISDENNSNSDVNFDDTFAEAKKLKDDKQLVKAISGFNDAVKVAETSKQKADCYEEIATIYAVTKKYGTALSFAQKAYNMSPSTSREILLARLYYKTGNADKASDRINNVLRRDFTQDN